MASNSNSPDYKNQPQKPGNVKVYTNQRPTTDELARKVPEDSISQSAKLREERRKKAQREKSTTQREKVAAPQYRPNHTDQAIKKAAHTASAAEAAIQLTQVLSSVWWLLVPLYFIQCIGAGISIIGLLVYYGFEAVPLFGSFLAENTGALEVYSIGIYLALAVALFSYMTVFILSALRGVSLFTWPIMLIMIVTFCMHTIPGANLIPWILLWMGSIVLIKYYGE